MGRMRKGAGMERARLARLGIMLAVVAALSACQMGLMKSRPKAEPAADAAAAPDAGLVAGQPGGERDVEAPEIFSRTDKALWDGRPSLGGVWVAHASVKDPERVVMRNAANGKTVIGALFRREVDNPGPSLQLSSDAAEALGLLAGQPAVVEVVALKRIEAPEPAAEPAPEAAPAPAAVEKPGKADAAPKGKPGKIEAKALDPVVAGAAAALDKAATEPATAKGAKPVAAAPALAAAPAAAAPAAGALRRAYLQIGIFSVEANAKTAQGQMQKAGMSATVKPDKSQGKAFWRVIVGPAATEADRNALAAKVKALGYPDAYAVSK